MSLNSRALTTAAWLFLFSPSIHCQDSPQPASDPTIEQLRQAVLEAFAGPRGYDEGSRLSLKDQFDEVDITAPCRSQSFVKKTVTARLTKSEFEEVDGVLKYPDQSLHVVRMLRSPSRLDILLFYFRVQKTPSLDCKFTLGMYGRREDANQKALAGNERDSLYRELNEIRNEIGKAMKE